MGGHHLVLGEMEDYLTGRIIEDSHDERYRQKIARYLVEVKGFQKADIQRNRQLMVRAGDRKAVIRIALLASLEEKPALVIHYGPGSLVTRLRPALAISRLMAPYQLPFAAVTNGEALHLIDTATGRVKATGMEALPSRQEVDDYLKGHTLSPIVAKVMEMEARIVYAYEVDGSCPCDDTICRVK